MPHAMCGFFFAQKGKPMQIEIAEVQSETLCLAYRIARIVYAETLATSLRVVEALTSMIANARNNNRHTIAKMICDRHIFESLQNESVRHKYLSVDTSRHDFQMCLRIAIRMLHGKLSDACNGATMFHRAELLPDWAIARGYIAAIDGILFYA